MTHSHSSGTLGTNQEAIAAFNERFANVLPEIGTTLVLPEQDQHHEVIGCRTWRDEAYFIFASKCMRCGKPYSFEVERGFKIISRTCLADKGQWRSDPLPMYPKQAILEVFDANRLIADSMPIEDAIKQAVAKLPTPRPEHDSRRKNVMRSIDKMVKNNSLGCHVDGDYFIFE